MNWIVCRNVVTLGGFVLVLCGTFGQAEPLLIFGAAMMLNGETWLRDLAKKQERERRLAE